MEDYKLAKIHDKGGDLSKRWYVSYFYKHPETHKFEEIKSWISSRIPTRSARYTEGTQIRNEINAKLHNGYNPFETEQKNYTFQNAINEILAIKAKTIGKRANTDYASMCNRFIKWLKDKNYYTIKPNYFNRLKAQQYADYLSISLSLSNRTVNNNVYTMRGIFEEMKKRGVIDINPFSLIVKLQAKETMPGSFSAADRQLIGEVLPKQHYPLYCIAMIIFYCYIRPAEIVRLRICDFDFDKNLIRVSGGKSKNGRTKPVVMHPHLVECLLLLGLERFDPNFFIFSTCKTLLPGAKECAPTRIADAWRWIMKEQHGLLKNIYDLKATGAGLAFENGIDARQIQMQIRHSSLDQTQIYLDKITNIPGEVFRTKMPSF